MTSSVAEVSTQPCWRAAAVVPGTFAPSLTPRSWIDQGVITGLASGVTYLLTVITHDGIEILASRLPVQGADPAERQRKAVLMTNLAVIPVGLAVQRALSRRPAEPTLRGLTRQVGWRTAVTGVGGAALAGARGLMSILDRRVGAGGRLERFPMAVPTGLALALAVEWQRSRGADEPLARARRRGNSHAAAFARRCRRHGRAGHGARLR